MRFLSRFKYHGVKNKKTWQSQVFLLMNRENGFIVV